MPCGGCKTDCKCSGQKCGDACSKGGECKCNSKAETKPAGSCCKGKGGCQ